MDNKVPRLPDKCKKNYPSVSTIKSAFLPSPKIDHTRHQVRRYSTAFVRSVYVTGHLPAI